MATPALVLPSCGPLIHWQISGVGAPALSLLLQGASRNRQAEVKAVIPRGVSLATLGTTSMSPHWTDDTEAQGEELFYCSSCIKSEGQGNQRPGCPLPDMQSIY